MPHPIVNLLAERIRSSLLYLDGFIRWSLPFEITLTDPFVHGRGSRVLLSPHSQTKE